MLKGKAVGNRLVSNSSQRPEEENQDRHQHFTCSLRRWASMGMIFRMGRSTTSTLGLLLIRHPLSMSQSAPSRYSPDTKHPRGTGREPGLGSCCSVPQSCVTLLQPHRLLLHGISQAKILEWVAISSSRGSSQPRDQTLVSCIGSQILYHRAMLETLDSGRGMYNSALWLVGDVHINEQNGN